MNNIHLFGMVMPFIYLYALLKFPVNLTRSVTILLSFLLGLTIDLFSNTWGMHAAACSFFGFIRKPLLEQLVDMKEMPDGSIPSYRLFGYGLFFRYTLMLVIIHALILFTVESFGFFQPKLMFVRMTTSILLTSILLFIIEAFNPEKEKNGE